MERVAADHVSAHVQFVIRCILLYYSVNAMFELAFSMHSLHSTDYIHFEMQMFLMVVLVKHAHQKSLLKDVCGS